MAVKLISNTVHLQFSFYKMLNGKINSLIIMFCAKCFVFFYKRLFVSDSQYALYISCFADTWHLQFSFYTPQGTRAKNMYTKLTYAHNFCFLSKIQMIKRELLFVLLLSVLRNKMSQERICSDLTFFSKMY